MGVFASKAEEVSISVWSRALFCAKVLLFNALRDDLARRESEYATFPMGVGFGR
jgi:hypothetical protein